MTNKLGMYSCYVLENAKGKGYTNTYSTVDTVPCPPNIVCSISGHIVAKLSQTDEEFQCGKEKQITTLLGDKSNSNL